MLTRFRYNVSRYPRLFVTVVVALVATLATTYGAARLVGIGALPATKLVAALVLVSLMADGILYSWILRSGSRTSALLDMLDRFEGRDRVCGHLMDTDSYGDEVRCTLRSGHEGGHSEEIETYEDPEPEYDEEQEHDAE